jgi:hypothetical protein
VRTVLFISLLATGLVRGEEAAGDSVREKLRAKILASAPPLPVKRPPDPAKDEPAAPPPLLMNPVIVSETRRGREVAAAIARQEQEKKDDQFSPVSGGMIGNLGPLKLGGWWSPTEGWTFLRKNKPPSQRQVEETQAVMKDLLELAAMAEDRHPSTQPSAPPSPASGAPQKFGER